MQDSEKNDNIKFISKYSNGKTVSPAQYITEIICEKKAILNNKDLHYKFWQNNYWMKYYKNQIGVANKLLKKYSAKAIIAALRSEKCKKIYSLRAPHLIDIIEEEESRIGSQNTNFSINVDRKTDKKFISSKNKPSMFSELEDL
jgi:hypothetical protein